MKVKALKKFEGIRDNERNVYPKEGDVWEVTDERGNFLKEHGVVEIVEEEKTEEVIPEVVNEVVEETKEETKEDIKEEIKEEKPKASKKKKPSKK